MCNILKIGDTIMWRGGWGTYIPLEAKVKSIEIVSPDEKEGEKISSVPWEVVEAGYVVVVLDNNHWAYGYQISPVASTLEPV